MHRGPGILRILVAFLILRIFAAPVAARPDAARSLNEHRFIVRICAWPVQRPERPTLTSRLSVGSTGRSHFTIAGDNRVANDRRNGSSARIRHSLIRSYVINPVHLDDRPRC